MTATPSPKGVEPKEPEPKLVIEPNEAYSFILEALEELKASGSYHGRMLATTALGAFEKVRADAYYSEKSLATLTTERDEAQKRAEVAEAENVRLTEFMKRAHGNLAAALIAPSAKLETDLEVGR